MKNDDSLLRPGLEYLDLIYEGQDDGCDARLTVTPGHIHDCTRPPGHNGQHYSFSAESGYEIIWPIGDVIARKD